MKKTLFVMGLACLMSVNGHAASWIVWPGQSLQAAITNAVEGDNITIKEGNYVENIVLNKGLDIRGEPGHEGTTQMQGTWLIQNATTPIYLKGFKVGVSQDGSMSVANCSDVRMDYIAASPASLTANNSKLYIYRSSFSSNAIFNGGDWTLQRSTITGALTNQNAHTKILASTISGNVTHLTYAKDCTVFQSYIGEKLTVVATNYWIGYNTIRYAEVRDGKGTCEIVGNRIDLRDSEFNGLYVANTSPFIRNNAISNGYFNFYSASGPSVSYNNMCNGVVVESGSPVLVNNVINDFSMSANNINSSYDARVTNCINGIRVNTGSNPRVIGNIIQNFTKNIEVDQGGNGYMVYAPASAEVKYSDLRGTTGGGCTPTNCINADPLITGDFVLQAGSPCINANDPDAQYNDLDNTRGDIGLWGGHSYDPSGRTTTNPVVMATEAAPLYIKRGQTITLKARGAVAAD